MTPLQFRSLNELCAACDESLHYHPDREPWIRTFHLSGTKEERSSTVYKSLIVLGFVEGQKTSGLYKQSQWLWKITPVGREELKITDGTTGRRILLP